MHNNNMLCGCRECGHHHCSMFGHVCSNTGILGVQTLAGSTCSSTQLQLGWLDEDKKDTLPGLNYTFGPAICLKLLWCCAHATETGKKNMPMHVLNG